MKKQNFIYFLLLTLLVFGFWSCNNEDDFDGKTEDNPLENVVYVSDAMRDSIEANLDPTIYYIDTEEDLNNLLLKISEEVEKDMGNDGYTKQDCEPSPLQVKRASIQEFKKYEITTYPVENSQFKAKFSSAVCNLINKDNDVNPIKSTKTYVCGWRIMSPFHNLASNQSGGSQDSPLCGLIPSTKTGYTQRGYEAYVNSHNQFIMVSNVLNIMYEDVKKPTIYLDIRHPAIPRTGYEFKYAILTR